MGQGRGNVQQGTQVAITTWCSSRPTSPYGQQLVRTNIGWGLGMTAD